MIEIRKKPYECSFSKNQITFEVASNAYFKSVKIVPSITMELVSFPATGDHYIFQFINPETEEVETFRLVAATGYTSSSDRIPDASFAGTNIQYMDIVFDRLINSDILTGWYIITREDTTTIKITARYPKEELIPIMVTNQASSYLDFTIDKGTIDPEIRDGYEMRAQVYIEKEYRSGSFEMVSDVECYLDQDAVCLIDFSDILDKEIEASWDEYPMPEELAYVAPNLFRYYVRFVEYWNNEPDVKQISSDIMFVHWGGISTEDEMMADPVYLGSQGNWLTWWPSGKKSLPDQKEWLGWMNHYQDATFDLKLKVHHSGGTSTFTVDSIELKRWETIIIATGYNELYLESLVPGQTINSWELAIENPSTHDTVSNWYKYYAEKSRCLKRIIMYFNSFGIPETFWTSGELTEEMNVSTEIANRSNYFSRNRLFPGEFIFDSRHKNAYTAVTGPLTNTESVRLQPLLNSLISFIYEDSRWVPVIINTNRAQVKKINEYIQRIELELVKANYNKRASFHEVTPELLVSNNCGVLTVVVEKNGLDITTYGDITITAEDGSAVGTVSANVITKEYTLSPITNDGKYKLEVELDNQKLIKWIDFAKKRFTFETDHVGTEGFSLRAASGSQSCNIDWGEGGSESFFLYSNILTATSHTFTKTGTKLVQVKKACFDDVVEFSNNGLQMKKIDFSVFPNLEKLTLIDSAEGSLYLSQLEKIQEVTIQNTSVTRIDLGFQRDLTSLSTDTIDISSDRLDELFIQFWKNREYYSGTPTISMLNLGFTPSATVTAIIDGTGVYAGEGLNADYSWTITLS